MSQPVKLSDALVLDARLAGEARERSIAGQVEYWASLGKSVELLLNGKQVLALRGKDAVKKIAEALATVDSPAGRARVEAVLARRPYPHFEQYSGRPDLLVRIDEDGTKTTGRFVNREFVAVKGVSLRPEVKVGRAGTVSAMRTRRKGTSPKAAKKMGGRSSIRTAPRRASCA